MRVFIVGLGLIGTSYALRLKSKGYQVDGYDINQAIITKALKQNVIENAELEAMKHADLIVLALYPGANVSFVQLHRTYFNDTQVITDVSGVKTGMIEAIESHLPNTIQYVSHHPMAGSEKPGFDAAKSTLFEGANIIVTPSRQTTQKALNTIKVVAEDIGFKQIIETSPQTHDQTIAYTSQLPHALAIALINANDQKDAFAYAGNSFKDLTRIASINAEMWSELFTSNAEPLSNEIEKMIEQLKTIQTAINQNDIKTLQTTMLKAKERRDSFGDNQND